MVSKFCVTALLYFVIAPGFCVAAWKADNATLAEELGTGFYDNADGSPIFDLIAGARTTLDMEIYEMDDLRVIGAVREALARGVNVRIVKEPKPVGSACYVFDEDTTFSRGEADTCDEQRELVDEVIEAGGQYVPFSKPALCGGSPKAKNCLEHGKLAIADSEIALITTGNFNTTNLCDLEFSPGRCNRDYTYLTDDPKIVTSLKAVIERDLMGQPYEVESVVEEEAKDQITIGPDSLKPLLAFIHSAEESIIIQNQYLKEPNINAALMEASRKGIDVKVMVASACAFGKPKPSAAAAFKAIFSKFDEAGISSKMFNKNILINGKDGYLHAKAIIIDREKAWLGSVNGSTQGTTLNREFGIFFNEPTEVFKLYKRMMGDFTDPNEETWQESLDCAEDSSTLTLN
ncbi:MAG: hypothetical protein HY537_18415 [Deltaproteobacteria bacterium]|nr:hypothetical protein [Deltaproteobacteria bacterium]